MAEFDLVPSRTALIDVDMQVCFVEGTPLSAPDGPAVLTRVERIAAASGQRACRSCTPG